MCMAYRGHHPHCKMIPKHWNPKASTHTPHRQLSARPLTPTHPLHMPGGGTPHVVHALPVAGRHGGPRLAPPPLQLRHGRLQLAVAELLGCRVQAVAGQLGSQLSLKLLLRHTWQQAA